MNGLAHNLALIGLLTGANAALGANEISVVVTSGSSSSTTFRDAGADVTVALNGVNVDTFVRIFDNTVGSGAPVHSIGKVTIDGTVASGSPVLKVMVANANQTMFPLDIDDVLDRGVVNLGGTGSGAGIKIYNSSNNADTSLRDRTRVAIGVSGDITGTIHVAEVFRIQADDDILAAVTATGTLVAENGFQAISRVAAGDSVAGAITAQTGNIDLVSVGPNTATTGISGDITAANEIRSVFSTGPIGNGSTDPNLRMKITAGNRIEQIRTVSEASPGTVLDRDVDANIVANQAIVDAPTAFNYEGPPRRQPVAARGGRQLQRQHPRRESWQL